MSKTAVITARIDEDTLQALDALAADQERTRAWLVGKAIKRYVEEETTFRAFIKEGEDAIDRGEYYTQEQMEEWFASRYRTADAA
jgi:predicted transcriptional regulator